MSDTVIKVENLSKLYRLGVWGTGTLKDDIKKNFAKWTGREDPTVTVGSRNQLDKVDEQEVWALKDINFEVKQGEVLGIIGKNGAGKSTLLKILSEITAPTTGAVKIKGRVASLLEVGTGMHPELTGRENIFLNGAILGMRRWEIKSKFDEIVDFAGIAKYVDTPIKRYSSGMRVRLGFAIAAFLEPEILIVDEVLAVGDAEFQKRAIGKMKEVSHGRGRTVIFVSHNMVSVNTLCSKALWIANGKMIDMGNTSQVVSNYLLGETYIRTYRSWDKLIGDQVAVLLEAEVLRLDGQRVLDQIEISESLLVIFKYQVFESSAAKYPNIHLFNAFGHCVFASVVNKENASTDVGIFEAKVLLPGNFLNTGSYSISLALSTLSPTKIHFFEKEALSFEIIENMNNRDIDYFNEIPGVVRPHLRWEVAVCRTS